MKNRKLLIVDDQPENLALLGDILSDDYDLSFASDGREALALIALIHPALVLLDVDLPDTNGYEVCRRIKNDPALADIPVIFVTSHSDVKSENDGFEMGGVDYLVKPVSPPIVKARVRTHLSLVRTVELENSYRDAIHMLGQADHYNDTDTGVHIWRMAAYARQLAIAAGWNQESANLLELAAPMHDTGKIGIPDSILRKPGKLDADEWAIMQTHCRIGYNILIGSGAPIFQLAATVALHHHEKWNGAGYPNGLAGEAIPEAARIVALADVFDALTMTRPYKEAWPMDRVIAEIESNAGLHFEPRLVDLFRTELPNLLKIKEKWSNTEAA